MSVLRARKLVDFASAHAGGGEVTAAALDLGGLVHAASSDPISGHGLITSSADGRVRSRVEVRGASFVPRFVQPFLGGFLLAEARDRGRSLNALVVDGTGAERSRLALGDAIADVRVGPDGTVWVSYFDEAAACGGPGLVAFAPDGSTRFSYDPARAGTDFIMDAYAMNLAGPDDVWLYFYTEFPIVRVHRGRYHVWRCGHHGARALAVRGDRVLLVGTYDQRDSASVFALGGAVAERVDTTGVEGPDGEPLDRHRIAGYGADVLFYDAHTAYVLDDW